ncbi:hypothetical protein [Amycolatopsis magusensis]|uniref:DUF3558 domain-containing protein n=1 Tax=Amycolatopsis magusensis TaxID=882444 RepID=A0ABS4PPA9_9PSEU|nr:hypothetical protein [Amycolatopsis magusensis]MBP2181270.1 hypothetical protein [Amycolatopsis magusensis]
MRSLGIGMVLMASLTTVGCAGEEPGRPTPDPATQSGELSPVPPTGGESSRGIFGDTKACELLDPVLPAQGFPAGEPTDIGGDNGCTASKSGASTTFYLDDQQSIDDLKGSPEKKFTGDLNGRRLLRVEDVRGDGGGCQIGIEVAAKARAVVTIVLGSNRPTAEACELAATMGTEIEPKLPRG